MPASKSIFTTGEAAEVCKVSQQTIIRCFDAGRIGGFRVPGSKFRRIPRDELIRFMRENDIPTVALESSVRRVLLIDDDAAACESLRAALAGDDRFALEVAGDAFDAGWLLAGGRSGERASVVVVDPDVPGVDLTKLCRRAHAPVEQGGGSVNTHTRVVVITRQGEAAGAERFGRAGADAIVSKSINPSKLAERIAALAGL